MKKSIAIYLSIFVLLALSACKKYEDGPALSLLPKKSRVVAAWKVKHFIFDGNDIIHFEDSMHMDCQTGEMVHYSEKVDNNVTFDMKRNGDLEARYIITHTTIDDELSYFTCTPQYTTSTEIDVSTGSWEFVSDKEKLQINLDGSVLTLEIKELREKKMKLEGTDSNDHQITMELEKK